MLRIRIGVLAGFTTRVTRATSPRGTSVLGIDIGGLDRSDAAARLHAGLDGKPALDQPITVHITGDTAKAATPVTPDQVGLGVDVDATVAAAAGGPPAGGSAAVHAERHPRRDPARRGAAPARRAVTADAATPASVTFDGVDPQGDLPVAGQEVDSSRPATR